MPSLFDESFRKKIANYILAEYDRLELNAEIFAILEGRMSDLLAAKMIKDLGEKSASAAMERIAPINYYRKVIDKLTTIYQQGVTRKVVGGSEQDQELVDWYVKKLRLNSKMNANNENFNAYQYSLLNIALKDPDPITGIRDPFLRSIPNHQFLVMNTSSVDPTSPDVIIICAGQRVNPNGKKVQIYHVYTETEFIVMDGEGNILESEMDKLGQDGLNDFMEYPFVYANDSENLVMPMLQIDDKQMALLIPLLLTDLNYANKFQAFSMFYGIDVDDAKLEISPNAWLNLKSDENGIKPEFGTIKPTVDSDKTLSTASSEISLWLSSKGVRPGTIGQLDGDAFASGISKMIDESDTFESRKRQIEEYKYVEQEFWEKLLKVFHPMWVAMGVIENTTIFTSDAEVVTIFQEPKPLQTRDELVDSLEKEVRLGFIPMIEAMRQLHPDLDEDELTNLMAEIEAESILEENGNGEEQDRDENNPQSA